MDIYLNDKTVKIDEGTTVETLLAMNNISSAGTAVALGGKLVPKSTWGDTVLNDGDKIMVISAAYGG